MVQVCASQGRKPNLPDIYCITQSDFCPAYNGGTVSCDHDVWPWTLILGQWGYPDWLRFLKIATPMTSSLCASTLSALMWSTSVWMVKLCHMFNLCPIWKNYTATQSYWHNIPLFYEMGLTVWHWMVISHNDMHSLLPGQNSVVSRSS